MGSTQPLSSITCEFKIKQAKNTEVMKFTGNIFVRYYISSGNNQRMKLDTREISSKLDHVWNESFLLECSGNEDSLKTNLKHESIVFELRCRNRVPVFGKIGGSQLLGKAEIPWKEVIDSPNMVLDKWVTMISTRKQKVEGVKPPKLQVEVKVGISTEYGIEKQRQQKREKKWEECGCKEGHDHMCTCEEYYDIFALVAALEAF